MNLKRITTDTPLATMLTGLEEDGGIIIEGMFELDVVQRMCRDVKAASEEKDAGTGTQGLTGGEEFAGKQTKRFSTLGKISPAYYDILDNKLYQQLADAVLLPTCGSYWVNTGMAMLIGPGNPAQVLHRDSGNWAAHCAALWPNCPEVTISAIIALDEVTEELGATRVIPGSHKGGEYARVGDPNDTVPAELSPGDALIYSGHVLHGGGANETSSDWRVAIHLSFVVGWLTPEESSPLDYTDEDLASRSPRVQRLLGHRSYNPAPHFGGGLWLRQVQAMESINGYD